MSSDMHLLTAARKASEGIAQLSHGQLSLEVVQEAGKRKEYKVNTAAGACVFRTKSVAELSVYWAGLEMGTQIGRLLK